MNGLVRPEPVRHRLVRLLATGFGTGFAPLWPGTAGTIPALVIVFLVGYAGQATLSALAATLTALSVWLAGEAEKLLGHDNKCIVIDEWAGMAITVLLIPFTWYWYLFAFGFFRLFDAIKIFPARQAEKLPSGWGVTADDVVAGLQANVALQLVIRLLA